MKDRTSTFSKLAILTTTVVGLIAGSAAYAAGPSDGGDFFGINTNPMPTAPTPPRMSAPPPMPMPTAKPMFNYGDRPAQKWFASFDEQVCTHLVRDDEKIILTGSFGDPPQLEKVVLWTNTAGRCAKRYRDLAKNLKRIASAAPHSLSSEDASATSKAMFYCSSLADWYNDSASVFEEYIKPRPAASTQEELEDQLKKVHDHSLQVKESYAHLAEMEKTLRGQFGVPSTPRYADKLMEWVARKPIK